MAPGLSGIIAVVLLLISVVAQSHGHKWRTGRCPMVLPMKDFNKDKIIGRWTVQRSLSNGEPCMTFMYSKDGYNLKVVEKDVAGNGRISTGKMTSMDDPGQYSIAYDINRITAKYTFVYTDYTDVAFVAHCQQFLFFHRINVYALSRTNKLNMENFNNNAWRLSQYDLMPYDLAPAWGKQCPAMQEQPSDIHS